VRYTGRMSDDYDFCAQRLYVSADLRQDAVVALTRDQVNYLVNVLRLGDGAVVHIFNGRDGEWRASLVRQGRRDATLTVERLTRPQTAGPDIHYLFAPLKRARLDYMVQKATELGVARLAPVITRHTVAERVNLDRMRANVTEAAEQCGILRIPEVAAPATLAQALERWEPARRLVFCDESAPVQDPIRALEAVEPGPLAVLIGPEGGFAEDERALLLGLPCVVRLALGPRIMRADTAAVAALALVNAVLGDWRGPAQLTH
jgi:16S rRNA (uracil1498-N3)-methyltransferase